jgi:hypothetical protein
MLIIEDPTVIVKARTDNVTNSSKGRALILFGDKHQLTSLHDRHNDNMLENGKCRN